MSITSAPRPGMDTPPPPPAPGASAAASDRGRGTSPSEIIAGVLLCLTAIVAVFAAYQGALADGDSLEGYTQSTQHQSDATVSYTASAQQLSRDQQLFVAFATAANTPGQEDVANYITDSLMDDNLRAAVDWWATSDVRTPFDDDPDNPYADPAGEEADLQQAAAEASFAAGSAANEVGDRFDLAELILVITLFFAGVSTLMRSPKVRWGLLVVSTATLIGGASLVLATYASIT